MARAMRLSGAVLCLLVLCMAAPAVESRKMGKGMVSLAIRVLCIPTTESLLIEHEGRHQCAYELPNGDKAVGVGYDLDDDKETRRSELSTVLADYDKVYDGKDCLNTIQISALLALDARRALDRAAKSVKSLDEQCCDVQAVFGDIQHSGGKDVYEQNGFEDFIEAVSAKKWDKAADTLEKTRWCSDNKDRCRDNKGIITKGCGNSVAAALIAQVTNRV
ncbi:hypothetical protein M758_12G063600 [Ceratodon purpureus]|nr:hypothetical protein M758_12G063600 [Ceratodon purpureus]